MGMRMNPEGYSHAHPSKGAIGMFTSVLATGFRVPLDRYERAILTHLELAPIQLTPNSWRLPMGLRVAFREQGYDNPSIDLLKVLFKIHANKPPRTKTSRGT